MKVKYNSKMGEAAEAYLDRINPKRHPLPPNMNWGELFQAMMDAHQPEIKIRWDLYRESGKWAYGGEVDAPREINYWNDEATLEHIDSNQSEVADGVITRRGYDLVLSEVCDPEEVVFVPRIIRAVK